MIYFIAAGLAFTVVLLLATLLGSIAAIKEFKNERK